MIGPDSMLIAEDDADSYAPIAVIGSLDEARRLAQQDQVQHTGSRAYVIWHRAEDGRYTGTYLRDGD